jgi:hypothetical protein
MMKATKWVLIIFLLTPAINVHAWPNPRFIDNGNGTVTDNLTTMVWAEDANLMKTREGSIHLK